GGVQQDRDDGVGAECAADCPVTGPPRGGLATYPCGMPGNPRGLVRFRRDSDGHHRQARLSGSPARPGPRRLGALLYKSALLPSGGGTVRNTWGMSSIAILGAGKIGEALLSGLLSGERDPDELMFTEHHPERDRK